jgi:hypothetical protein
MPEDIKDIVKRRRCRLLLESLKQLNLGMPFSATATTSPSRTVERSLNLETGLRDRLARIFGL